MPQCEIFQGDCLETMRTLPDNSVHSIVTDPPYGLSFMGKKWDYDVPSEDIWRECLRVLKPGGHLLAFAGTRTQHRMAVRIEDAGFEIRDMIAWVYSSGFPKSLDVSKAIDKAAGAERERVLVPTRAGNAERRGDGDQGATYGDSHGGFRDDSVPVTPEAQQWSGFGTALKPSHEPISVCRKPFSGTVAANVLEYGTGAINVDGCRVGTSEKTERPQKSFCHSGEVTGIVTGGHGGLGRWPANLIHDGSDEVVGLLNEAARFFYCAKCSKRDRDEGCEGIEEKVKDAEYRQPTGNAMVDRIHSCGAKRSNHHPTVKPTDLMRYLCRLVTPPGGIVLDPFMGSGSTGKAAVLEGFGFIGCELDPEYVEIARARINAAGQQPGLGI